MSYDLMVFNPDVAPKTRQEFMIWFQDQAEWTEEHSYDDPVVTTNNLKDLFIEIISTFPAMNGPYAKEDDDEDNKFSTDYCIGQNVIYVAFSWSLAEQAYEKMKTLAKKHKVGFFDVSADDGDILFPDNLGNMLPIDRPDNLSSIEQITRSAAPAQEGKSVKEILYSKLNLQAIAEQANSNSSDNPVIKRAWWRRVLGLK